MTRVRLFTRKGDFEDGDEGTRWLGSAHVWFAVLCDSDAAEPNSFAIAGACGIGLNLSSGASQLQQLGDHADINSSPLGDSELALRSRLLMCGGLPMSSDLRS